MRLAPTAALALAVMALASCASSGGSPPAEPPAPAPFDPVGTYTFATTVEGAAVAGELIIRGEPGNYTGLINPTSGPITPLEIYAATVEGQQVTAFADAGGDDVILVLNFTDEGRYTGTWTLGFDSGEIAGERVPQ